MAEPIDEARGEIARLQGELQAARQELSSGSTERATLRGRITKLENEAEAAATARTAAEAEAQTKHAAEVAALKGDLDQAETSFEFRAAALKAGVHSTGDAVALGDLSGITRDKDGKLVGVAEAIEALKTARPYLFGEPPKPGAQLGTTRSVQQPPTPADPNAVNARTMPEAEWKAERARVMGMRH